MKRLVRGRARLIAVVVALVVMATASSCAGGGGGSGGAHPAAKPVITPKQAAAVVIRVDSQRVRALTSQDASVLPSLEAVPELTIDQNGLQKARALGTTVTTYPYASVTAIVPKETVFPAWFLALAKNTQGDTALDLLMRESATAPWRLAAETRLEAGPIEWKEAPGGWAVPADLNLDPSETLSAYWTAAIGGGDAAGAGVRLAP